MQLLGIHNKASTSRGEGALSIHNRINRIILSLNRPLLAFSLPILFAVLLLAVLLLFLSYDLFNRSRRRLLLPLLQAFYEIINVERRRRIFGIQLAMMIEVIVRRHEPIGQPFL